MSNRAIRHVRIGIIVLCATALLLAIVPALAAQAQGPVLVKVLQSDTSRVVLELDISSYNAQRVTANGATYSLVTIPDLGQTGEAGKPQLPIKGSMVGIPPGAQASLKVVANQSRTDRLAAPPLPAPTAQVQSDPRQVMSRYLGDAYAPNAAAYSANQFYPTDAARIASTGDWRSQHYVVVEFHPLQYNPATRQLIFHQQLRVEIDLSYPRGPTAAALGGSVSEGPFESVFQNTIINYSSARNWRARSAPTRAPAPHSPSTYSGGPWYRIGVNADGIYQVTCGELAAALGSALPATLNSATLQVFKNGTELAINVVGNGWAGCTSSDTNDYIEFFGQAPNARYTNTNMYWLTYNQATGKRMTTHDGTIHGTETVATTYTTTLHLEQNLMYRAGVVTPEGDHWFWSLFYGSTVQAGYPVTLTNLTTTGGPFTASLQVELYGVSSGNNETQLSINGAQIDDTFWAGPAERLATINFPQADLVQGSNTITLTEPTASNGVYLNYFNLSYSSPLTAANNFIRFQQPVAGAWAYHIGGFTSQPVETFDIVDPFNVARVVNTTVTGTNPYTLNFADSTAGAHEYIALALSQRLTPASITYKPNNSSLSTGSADYIIIAYGGTDANGNVNPANSFISHVTPLANLRQSQGMRVRVVDVQEIYDEFNDGLVDPQAIHDFLYYAYTHWTPPAPSYVLLVGSGTFDPKGYCSATPSPCNGISTPPNSTLIPPYLMMVDPYMGETSSDNRLVAFNSGNTLPTMYIGRLPAYTTSDVDAMVAKIVNYDQNPPAGSWRSMVSFVTGSAYLSSGTVDPAGNFWAYSDETASNPQYMSPGMQVDRIYYNACDPNVYPQCSLPYPPYTTPAATNVGITSAINSGRLIVNFIGHSSIQYWSGLEQGEPVFSTTDVAGLTNANKTPVTLEMTCLTGYFIYPGLPGLADTNVRLAGNGAVASWAASGQGVSTGHDLLDKGFFNAVMNQGVRQLGPATLAGKTNLYLNGGGINLDLLDTFDLLGDPGSRLPIQFSYQYFLPLIQR